MRLLVLSALCLLTLAGCDSNPAQPTCTYTLSATSMTMGAAGGAGSITVTTGSGCSWTGSSSASWITATGGTSASGPGTYTFNVAALSGTASRTGSLTVAGQTVSVTQQGQSCTYTLQPASRTIDAAGATASFDVNTDAACGWTVTATAPWLSVVAGGSGSGNAHGHLSGGRQSGRGAADGQPHGGRPGAHGHADRPEQLHGRSQQVPGLVLRGRRHGVVRRERSLDLRVGRREQRRLGPRDRAGGGIGSGSRRVTYVVDANPGAGSRSGTMTVGGRTFTVTQAGTTSCDYSVAPVDFRECNRGGFERTVAVSDRRRLRMDLGAGGIVAHDRSPASPALGPGTIVFKFADNYDAARQANIEVRWPTPTAGQNVRVCQAGCTYVATRDTIDVPAAGGDFTFDVVSRARPTRRAAARCRMCCMWNARVVGLVGDGADVDAALRRRPGVRSASPPTARAAARTATITVRDKTVTIRQAGS